MSRITYITGDATTPIIDGKTYIVHIVNDLGHWGRGFVIAVSARWSAPEKKYKEWKKNGFADPAFGMGQIQIVDVSKDLYVVNMVAQEGVFRIPGKANVKYPMVESCLKQIAETKPKSVHMPRIGCGLGGGDWSKIEAIIQYTLIDAGIDVYVYDL